MSGKDIGAISLTNPPAIHVGPIVTPGSNETISIVIPLSAQVATISQKNFPEQSNNPTSSDNHHQKATTMKTRKDKVTGCPFPTCSRFGHAFSRAHDLKRHIARHESRKEKLSDIQQAQIYNCSECNQSFLTNDGLRVHLQLHLKDADLQNNKVCESVFSCHVCKKKYTNENKLKVHLLAHKKKPEESTCTLCGASFEHNENFQNHMKEHTASILQAQAALQNSNLHHEIVENNEDDNFLLEEMLLFKKESRHLIDRLPDSLSKKVNNSIRCNYCFKTFKTKWTLNCHVAAHEGRYQFDCRKCGKKFVRKSHYEGHVRSHEPARPYSCDQCGKSFKELKHRREHAKRKHPESAQNAVQTFLGNMDNCVGEGQTNEDQTKLTIFMPMNFNV